MAKKTLNDHLVTYYEGKRLSPRALANLTATLGAAAKDEGEKQNRVRLFLPALRRFFCSPMGVAYASVLVFLGYIAWMVTDSPNRETALIDLPKVIAREVAMNHRKQFNVEFVGKTIPDLDRQMGKLDFSLISPARFPEPMRIVGARYCSIQGDIAAQIQLTDAAGNHLTLYQTRLNAALTGVQDKVFELDGFQLKIWKENGILLGLAGPTE